MRKLKTSDVPAFVRVLTEAGIRSEVREIAEQVKAAGGNVQANDIGWNFILLTLERLSGKRAESMLYEFIAGPLELTPEEVADMDLEVFADNVVKWYKDCTNPDTVRRFFASVSRLMGQGSSMT